MGNIGPGGQFNQPFRLPLPNPFQGASTPIIINTPTGIPILLSPEQLQAAIILGQLLLAPLAAHQNALNPQEFSQFLKNLLHLPKEIQDFLTQLATGDQKQTVEVLKTLLQENPKLAVSLEELQNVLKTLTKDGENKLLQILRSSQTNYSGSSKSMGDMLSMMSQLSSRVASSPTEALTTTLLLYLPWHPLAENQKLTLYFEQPGSENEDGDGESGGESQEEPHLVLLVETNGLGRFKIVTVPLERTQLLFYIDHDAPALPYLKPLHARLNTALTQAGLQAPDVVFKQRGVRPAVFEEGNSGMSQKTLTDESPDTDDKQSIAVHSVGQVPVLVVQGAYWVARIIFELDEKIALETHRAEQV